MPRVALLTVYSRPHCTLKDVAGGFGTVFDIGDSIAARMLQYAKKRIARLPPTQEAYLAALFGREGWDVVVSRHPDVEADLYMLYSSITDCRAELRALEEIRRRRPRAILGVYGTFASTRPEYYAPFADLVVRGEVESLVPEIATANPRGIVTAPFLEDLDSLPFPAWHAYPYETYRYSLVTSRGITLPMISARGCIFECGYCPYKVHSQARERSLENVIEEIRHNVATYRMFGISFRDPLFHSTTRRALSFAKRILKERLNVRFSIEARADLLSPEAVTLLHRAGLRSIEIGIDSIDSQMLQRNGRRSPQLLHIEKIVRRCHAVGVRVIANYLFGLPEDLERTMRATATYARALNTFAVQFTMATPYPGTSFLDRVREKVFDWDYENWSGWANVYRHPEVPPSRLHRLREEAYVRYHFRPSYLLRFLQQTLWAN